MYTLTINPQPKEKAMKKVTIHKAVKDGLISGRIPFKAGSLSAREDNKGRYIVFSYNEPIALFFDKSWYITLGKFSVTTSRHTNIVYNQACFSCSSGSPRRILHKELRMLAEV